MISKLGVQLFTIRDYMQDAAQIRDSFTKLKDLGYDTAQTAGCPIPYEEFGAIARECGIEIIGTHDNPAVMHDDPEKAMADHQALGTTNMGTGGEGYRSKEDVERYIRFVNEICEAVHPYGFKFTYHNHSHEFIKYGEKTALELLAEGLDPEAASFCLDTYWVQHGGGDVRRWIEKLAGRIDILHLKDMGRDAEGPFITEVGNGNLYWDGVIETALAAGVKYFIVEQDTCPGDPFESLKISSEYIHERYMES